MYDIKNMNIWKKDPEKPKPGKRILEVEVSDLNLSVRSFNCLKRAGFNTVGDIVECLEKDENGLRKIRNLGSRSEKEILDCVKRYRDDFSKSSGFGSELPGKIIIKPIKGMWDMNIDMFHLSNSSLLYLKQHGINRIRDLYETDPTNEPGWYAVRELFEKIQYTLSI